MYKGSLLSADTPKLSSVFTSVMLPDITVDSLVTKSASNSFGKLTNTLKMMTMMRYLKTLKLTFPWLVMTL